MFHLHFLVGLLDSKLSYWEKLQLHLLYHILIMHLYILGQVMEIHRCGIAFMLRIISMYLENFLCKFIWL